MVHMHIEVTQVSCKSRVAMVFICKSLLSDLTAIFKAIPACVSLTGLLNQISSSLKKYWYLVKSDLHNALHTYTVCDKCTKQRCHNDAMWATV